MQIFSEVDATIFEYALNLCYSCNSSQQLLVRVDYNRFPRRRPHGNVTASIGGIVETSLAKLTHKTISFAFPGQIGAPITGQERIEKLQMVCHLLGESLVAGSCENNRASLPMLDPEVFEEDCAIWEQCNV